MRISHPFGGALVQSLLERRIVDLAVVDGELAPGAADERRQGLHARCPDSPPGSIARPDSPGGRTSASNSFNASATALRSRRRDGEAAALEDVELREIEAEEVQGVVRNHVLRVIAQQVVGGSRHRDAGREQPLFELAQSALAAAIGVGDERADASRRAAPPRRAPARPRRCRSGRCRCRWSCAPCGWPAPPGRRPHRAE